MGTLNCDGDPLLQREASEARLVSRSVETDDVSVDAFLRSPSVTETEDSTTFLWKGSGDGAVFAGKGDAVSVVAKGEDRFEEVRESVRRLFSDTDTDADAPEGARPRVFGGFSFHDTHEAEGVWEGFPCAVFVLPEYQISSRGGEGVYLTVNAYGDRVDTDELEDRTDELREKLSEAGEGDIPDTEKTPELRGVERTTTRPEWRRQVNAVLERIETGEIEKAVLSQSLELSLSKDVDVNEHVLRLSERFPDCYSFLFSPDGKKGFFGASPERLVSVKGRKVETEAIAGSIGRGDSTDEDEELGTRLRESDKDFHEHSLVVDTVVEQLRPLSESVETDGTELLKLENVQHLTTPVRAHLRRTDGGNPDVLSVAEKLHPTPAVGGFPPEEALRTIRETEGFERGWYAAPVGWVDGYGDGCFAVGLRSAVAEGSTATAFAGAGIVGNSDPDDEWDEVHLKYEPVLDLFEESRGETVDTA